MGDSGKAADAARASADGMDRPGRVLGRWLRAPGGERGAAGSEQLEQLEREVVLLREENARLKVAREQAEDRPVNERVRAALLSAHRANELDRDEPWAVLTECMLLRDGLVDACRELERGARELRGRLETILPNAEGTDGGAGTRPSGDLEGVV